MIRRREFITLLGGAAAAWPLAASAQQPGKLPTIGYLGAGTSASEGQRVAALKERLHQLGWVEGRNIAFESRWAEGRSDRAAEVAAEFVRLKVDIIVASGTPQVIALKQATSVIPIVSPTMGDPVGAGLVASLARPGGNVTGLSLLQPDLGGKRLEVLREAIPALRRLAIMGNSSNPPIAQEIQEVQAAAGRLDLEVATLEIRRAEDIRPAFDALKGRADALYLANDQLILSNRTRINILALVARLPTMYNSREYVEQGGVVSYGPNFADLFRRAADGVDKILRGARPADIPVEQPTKFDLVVNLITANAIGLTISPTLLARADEVIE
jgi:ABC-type uncharacterized transport system substrate-binding protein